MLRKILSEQDIAFIHNKYSKGIEIWSLNPSSFDAAIGFLKELKEAVDVYYPKLFSFVKSQAKHLEDNTNLHLNFNFNKEFNDLIFNNDLKEKSKAAFELEPRIIGVNCGENFNFKQTTEETGNSKILKSQNKDFSLKYTITFSDKSTITFSSLDQSLLEHVEKAFNKKMAKLASKPANTGTVGMFAMNATKQNAVPKSTKHQFSISKRCEF